MRNPVSMSNLNGTCLSAIFLFSLRDHCCFVQYHVFWAQYPVGATMSTSRQSKIIASPGGYFFLFPGPKNKSISVVGNGQGSFVRNELSSDITDTQHS